MENNENSKLVLKKDLNEPPRREQLVKDLENYKQNIDIELKSLKNNAISWAVTAGTAYLSYRVVRYLMKSSRKKDKKEQKIIVYEPEKKASGFWELIKREAAYALIDVLKEKVKDTFFNERAKEKDAESK